MKTNIEKEYQARQVLQFACQHNNTTFIIKNNEAILFKGSGHKLIHENPYNYLCEIKNILQNNNCIELNIQDILK